MGNETKKIEHQTISLVLEILHSKYLDSNYQNFISSIGYRKFEANNSLENKIALQKATRTFLKSGSVNAAKLSASQSIDTESKEMELVNTVTKSVFLADLTQSIYEDISPLPKSLFDSLLKHQN